MRLRERERETLEIYSSFQHFFVSRLCVRNLPPQFADKDLKKLAASNCEKTAK